MAHLLDAGDEVLSHHPFVGLVDFIRFRGVICSKHRVHLDHLDPRVYVQLIKIWLKLLLKGLDDWRELLQIKIPLLSDCPKYLFVRHSSGHYVI